MVHFIVAALQQGACIMDIHHVVSTVKRVVASSTFSDLSFEAGNESIMESRYC